VPIEDFDGNTFLAFLDISGFKEMMKNEKTAIKALNCFYKIGYSSLFNNVNINGFFISDSGLLFVRTSNLNLIEQLKEILKTIEIINRKLLEKNIMLTISIAYGEFKFQRHSEFMGISKNPIYGSAYVSAFLDNEKGKPKIQPGYCRLIIPDGNINFESNINLLDNYYLSRLVKKRNHYYFYWMVNDGNKIKEFENLYNNSYHSKYTGMLSSLKKHIH